MAIWKQRKRGEEILQDGVAPQCGVIGLEKDNRIDYPKDGSVPRGFLDSHSVGNYGWIFEQIKEKQKGYVDKR